jgi:hypothetical protein
MAEAAALGKGKPPRRGGAAPAARQRPVGIRPLRRFAPLQPMLTLC